MTLSNQPPPGSEYRDNESEEAQQLLPSPQPFSDQQPPVRQMPSGANWTPPRRPMPAQEYQQKQKAQAATSSVSSVFPEQTTRSTQQVASMVSTPDIAPSLLASRPRRPRRRYGIPVLITLFLLVLMIAIGAVVQQRFFEGTSFSATVGGTPTHAGAFVQPPLNTVQVDALRHLVGHMKYKQLASLYVQHMTLDEELGQLIMVEYNDTYYSQDLDTMINKLHAGGVIMYEFQMQSFDQTKHDIAMMQKNAKIPLLISADEEGGIVHRLTHIYPPRPSALADYETGNPAVATQQGHLAAQQLLALGINENLAPDTDVALIPNAPDQVTRTFGFTTDSVITYAGAYMRALQGDGVVACIKHYPGLGDASIDAHFGLPVVNRTKDQLYSVELAPFKHFIQSQNKLDNPGMIMPTDVLMPAIDPQMPAELSHVFMTDILRKEFGYDGVALTDALYMQGISKTWSMPQAAVLAINAGNDMLLGPTGASQMIDMLNGLKAAFQNGTLSKTRIDEAATRIIALKMQYHLMPVVPPQA